MTSDDIPQSWILSIGQVAQMFGESESTFRKHLPKRLAAGFPGRLPGSKSWSRPAVEHWFRTNGAQAPIEPVKSSLIEDSRRQLEEEYAA